MRCVCLFFCSALGLGSVADILGLAAHRLGTALCTSVLAKPAFALLSRIRLKAPAPSTTKVLSLEMRFELNKVKFRGASGSASPRASPTRTRRTTPPSTAPRTARRRSTPSTARRRRSGAASSRASASAAARPSRSPAPSEWSLRSHLNRHTARTAAPRATTKIQPLL